MCNAKLVQRGAWCRQLQEAKASATIATAYFRKPVQEANQLLSNQITHQKQEAAVRLHADPRVQAGIRETQSRQTARDTRSSQNEGHTGQSQQDKQRRQSNQKRKMAKRKCRKNRQAPRRSPGYNLSSQL